MHDSHPSRTFQPAQLQGKAIARRRRESERLAVLEQFVEERRRAVDLRNWIDTYAVNAAQDSETELTRMCEWARARLREYDLLLGDAKPSPVALCIVDDRAAVRTDIGQELLPRL